MKRVRIVKMSTNLKGTYVKELKMAAHFKISATTVIVRRTEATDSAKMTRPRVLRRQVADLSWQMS